MRTPGGSFNGRWVGAVASLAWVWCAATAPAQTPALPSHLWQASPAMAPRPLAAFSPPAQVPLLPRPPAPRAEAPPWAEPAKPSADKSPQQPLSVEERVLLPLLIEEKKLLADYGREHPDVLSVQERIRAVRDYLEHHPPAPPGKPEPPVLGVALPPLGSRLPAVREPVILPAALTRPAPPTEPSPKAAPPAPAALPANITTPPKEPLPKVTPPTPEPTREPAAPRSDFLPGAWGQVVAPTGIVLAVLLVHLLALSLIVRRHGKWFERRLGARLAGVLAPGMTYYQPAAPVAQPAAEIAQPDTGTAMEEATDPGTAETFDLGPTYEEEQLLKQEAERQRDEALLRHIFEDNVRLRQQLAELPAQAG